MPRTIIERETFKMSDVDEVGLKVKRERSTNFSLYERELLVELVTPRSAFIDAKGNTASIIKRKAKIWAEIKTKFNKDEKCTFRTDKQLQNAWKTLKAKAKQSAGKFKRDSRKTGGWPPPESIDDLTSKVIDVIPGDFQTIDNVNEDDSEEKHQESATQQSTLDDGLQMHTTSDDSDVQSVQEMVASDKPGPSFTSTSNAKKPMLASSGSRNKRHHSDDSGCADMIADRALNLHNMRLRYLEEEHKKRMRLLDIKIKFKQQEHDAKMRLIQKQQHVEDLRVGVLSQMTSPI